MATKFWIGRKALLTIVSGGTDSDILDLGGIAVKQAAGTCLVTGSTTTNVVTTQLSPNPSADFFVGKYIMFDYTTTTAALQGQQRLISASTTAGVLTVAALTTTPATGDTFGIYDLSGSKAYRRWDIMVMTPATVTGTVNVKVCDTETGTYCTVQSGGADIVLPTANKAVPLIPLVSRYLKIVGGAAGQNTIFTLLGSTIDID